MADMLDNIPPSLKSLWDVEVELRRAAQNAIFLRNDEAKSHLEEARRHLNNALQAVKSGSGSSDTESKTVNPNQE